MQKQVICLKKSHYKTKDNREIYRLHLWVDDGAVEYCTCNVDVLTYDAVESMAEINISYELNIFNSKIYGIKNVHLI